MSNLAQPTNVQQRKLRIRRRFAVAAVLFCVALCAVSAFVLRQFFPSAFHPSNHPWTRLHDAAGTGNLALARSLIAHGANVNAISDNSPYSVFGDEVLKETPLHIAAERGQLAVAKLLVEHGANVDEKNAWGQTPLYLAAQNGHPNVVSFLLSRGAAVDTVGDHGTSPFLAAGDEASALILIAHGANIHLHDQLGLTALGAASQSGFDQVVRFLLKKGASLDSDEPADSPLYLAASNDHYSTAKLLIDAGIDTRKGGVGDMVLDHAIESADVALVLLLLKKGANANNFNAEGMTPLLIAASSSVADVNIDHIPEVAEKAGPSFRIARVLIASGASVDCHSPNGSTPLLYAAQQGDTPMVALLIAHQAPINAQDNAGYTPLIWAATNDNLDAARLLVQAGVDCAIKGKDGMTALKAARFNKDPKLAALLSEHIGQWR